MDIYEIKFTYVHLQAYITLLVKDARYRTIEKDYYALYTQFQVDLTCFTTCPN